MNELFEYLYDIATNCFEPISFSGDIPSVMNRWLVKAQDATCYEVNNIKPFLKPEGRILSKHELQFLSQEEREKNWDMFVSDNYDHYLCQYNAIQKKFPLDKDKYIYALATVYCADEHESMIFCASMTPFSIWINGDLVYVNNYDSFVKESTFVYNFKKGLNTVLIEKPYFLRHEKLRINPDDFVLTIKPYEYCANPDENYFFDLSLFEKFKNMYTIIQNKAVYNEDDTIEALVLPRYFYREPIVEEVTLCLYDEHNKLLSKINTKTTTKVEFQIDKSYRGMLKITADVKGKDSLILNSYIVVGDLLAIANQAFDTARKRKDCNEEVIHTLNRLVTIPNLKVGTIRDYYYMMNTYIYHVIFEKLYEFIQYTHKPEAAAIVKPFDIFGYYAAAHYWNGIDEENDLGYYVVLPKNYDPSKKYPAVVHVEFGYGMSQLPIFREYHRFQDFDDIVLIDLCGRGGQNNDFIHEGNIYSIIEDAVKEYNLDRDRLYSVGACAGSLETFGLAMRNPGLFAGVFGANGSIRVNFDNPDYEQFNNLNTLFVGHIFCVEDTDFNCATVLDAFSHTDNAKLWPITQYSHEDFNESINSSIILKEALKHTRNRYPKKLYFIIFEPVYNRCHWIQVDDKEELERKGIVKAEIESKDRIVIRGINIRRLSVLLNKEEMNLSDIITLVVDGREYNVHLSQYERVIVRWCKDNLVIKQIKLTKDQYFDKFDAIAIEPDRLGIKQLYYSKCNIVYANSYKKSRNMTVKKLVRILSLPLVERAVNYHYEKFSEDDVEETVLQDSNFVYFANTEEDSKIKELLLQSCDCKITPDYVQYKDVAFSGETFAIMKCKNPYNADKFALLVICNSDNAMQAMLDIWGTFDRNLLFFSNAIIGNNNQYYSFR